MSLLRAYPTIFFSPTVAGLFTDVQGATRFCGCFALVDQHPGFPQFARDLF